MEKAIEKNNKGVAHFFREDFKKAKAFYEEALENDENNATALNNLGLLFHQKEEYEEAVSCYNKALKVNISDTYFLNLANTLVHLSRHEEAEENYKKCLEINPDNLNAKISLARFYQFNGKPEKSIGIWENIVSSFNNFAYKLELAKNYIAIGMHEKSLSLLSYLSKMGDNSEVCYYIGICELHLKNYGLAEIALKRCLGLEPDDFNARHYLSVNYLGKGDYKNALKELDFLIKIYPKELKVKLDKAIILLNLKKHKESLKLIDEVLKTDSKHEKALRYRVIVAKLLETL
ncbi:tetratricopeptide repeat protein [Mariniflexile sp. AS56]|uniref:tetratricopeptide repeat protein n=1 Tax=Mariniflexile sp. AS56 TaxID=3063957 RepID=UPI0026EBB7D0|nr:tetratricopeptide repeat protein [Mariniflexile sp. AS56]MDO7174054.1 tetratricopeptide repeat protein [Mariniflexile sp. AS56]